jgi:hypothetical protein
MQNVLNKTKFHGCLLCWPVLSPQMTGATVVDPPTIKLSVQVPAVGCWVVNVTKSKLHNKKGQCKHFFHSLVLKMF